MGPTHKGDVERELMVIPQGARPISKSPAKIIEQKVSFLNNPFPFVGCITIVLDIYYKKFQTSNIYTSCL